MANEDQPRPLGPVSPLAPQGMTRNADGTYSFEEPPVTQQQARDGKFTAGNQLWKHAARLGLKKQKYLTAEEMFEAVCGYFQWLEDNPLFEAKAFAYEGDITEHDLPKMRAATIGGMCVYLGICSTTWREWRNSNDVKFRPELAQVMVWAENCVKEQKFTGAAAGLLNAALVMRDLGLVDKSQLQGPGGGPLSMITADMDPQQAADAYKAMLAGDDTEQV
jgi:DNA-packaging protein gp3